MIPGIDNPVLFEFNWAASAARARLLGPHRKGPRVFGVGAAKTGTHSIGQMFDDRVASAHEVDVETLIYLHLHREKTGKSETLWRFLKRRDAVRNLKIDASHINLYLIDDFEALFPGSLYVMTIRHPFDWLRSFIDDSLRRDASDAFMRFRDYRFARGGVHPPEETLLKDRGLFTVAGYLDYWCAAMRAVERIPKDRRLVVRTDDISTRSADIAEFCGVAGGAAPSDRSKAYVNPERSGVLHQLPRAYVDAMIAEKCGELVQNYFPKHE